MVFTLCSFIAHQFATDIGSQGLGTFWADSSEHVFEDSLKLILLIVFLLSGCVFNSCTQLLEPLGRPSFWLGRFGSGFGQCQRVRSRAPGTFPGGEDSKGAAGPGEGKRPDERPDWVLEHLVGSIGQSGTPTAFKHNKLEATFEGWSRHVWFKPDSFKFGNIGTLCTRPTRPRTFCGASFRLCVLYLGWVPTCCHTK